MDFRRLESASREISAVQGTRISFPDHLRRMMQIVRDLVDCDSINVGTIDLETEEGFHLDLDGFLMPKERRENLPHFKHQHPMLAYSRKHGINPPLRFSDFYSRRQFEETGLYRECYRGYTHSMLTFGIDTPPGMNISFVLSRSTAEFTDGESGSLAVLQPLISVVYHRLLLQEALESSRFHDRPVGVIVGSKGNLITLDERARQIINSHFGGASPHRLPQAIMRQLHRSSSRIRTLVEQQNGDRVCGLIDTIGQEWHLRIWEETGPLSASCLAKIGLTQRQIEVLQWVAKGKTNAEIALILGISYRTVQKHLEHIYRAIGVETRLAAIDYCRNAHWQHAD